MLIYDKSPYIFLVLFRVLLPGLKYRLLSGLGRAPKGRKKKEAGCADEEENLQL